MNIYLRDVRTRGDLFVDPLYRDTRLTREGERQAATARAAVAQLPIDLLVVSPLSRALKTAQICFEGGDMLPRRVEVTPLASEKCWHASDVGRSPSTLTAEFGSFVNFDSLENNWWWENEDYDTKYGAVPSEEPDSEFALRCRELITWLGEQEEENIAVVCHWGVIAETTGYDASNCEIVSVDYANLKEAEVGGWKTVWSDESGAA